MKPQAVDCGATQKSMGVRTAAREYNASKKACDIYDKSKKEVDLLECAASMSELKCYELYLKSSLGSALLHPWRLEEWVHSNLLFSKRDCVNHMPRSKVHATCKMFLDAPETGHAKLQEARTRLSEAKKHVEEAGNFWPHR